MRIHIVFHVNDIMLAIEEMQESFLFQLITFSELEKVAIFRPALHLDVYLEFLEKEKRYSDSKTLQYTLAGIKTICRDSNDMPSKAGIQVQSSKQKYCVPIEVPLMLTDSSGYQYHAQCVAKTANDSKKMEIDTDHRSLPINSIELRMKVNDLLSTYEVCEQFGFAKDGKLKATLHGGCEGRLKLDVTPNFQVSVNQPENDLSLKNIHKDFRVVLKTNSWEQFTELKRIYRRHLAVYAINMVNIFSYLPLKDVSFDVSIGCSASRVGFTS